jgi:hypothetical protein
MSTRALPAPPSGSVARQNASPNDPNLYLFRSFYNYEVDTLPQYPAGLAPNGGQAVVTFNIAKDSDFFWTKLGVFASVGADGTVVSNEQLPSVNILLVNATNGRQYMNAPTPIANVSGSGRLPFILPVATLWEALTTIQVTLQNVSDNLTYSNIQLSFLGIKAFLRNSN